MRYCRPSLTISDEAGRTVHVERGGDAWRRVGDAIRARRTELRLTQKEAARAGGLSEPVWNVIEGARQTNYRLDTLHGVTRALGWSADSIDRILAGDEPTVQTRGLVPLADAGAEVAELRARVELLESGLQRVEVGLQLVRQLLEARPDRP